MKNILVTGAAGFIGSQLSYRLWKDGENVILLDDFSYGSNDNLVFEKHDFRGEIIVGDIRDTTLLEKLFSENEFDLVYHIAGITPLPDCQVNPSLAVDVNVRGTVEILSMAKKYNVKQVIFASTSAVYENNTDFPSVETNVVSPSLIYPSTKYTAEQYCKAFYEAYGMSIVCLRFANVYGPHIDCLRTQPPVMGYIIRELYKNESPILHSSGNQKRDFIYVDDLIDLAIAVQKCNGFDQVNVSSQTTVSINWIANEIAKQMKKEMIPIRYQEVGKYWERYPELYEGYFPINEKLLEHEVLKYTCLSNEHARLEYGWKPKTNMVDGIRATIEFSVKMLNQYMGEGR